MDGQNAKFMVTQGWSPQAVEIMSLTNGYSSINGDLNVVNKLTLHNISNLMGNVNTQANLSVNGLSTLKGNVCIGTSSLPANLTVTGNTINNGKISIGTTNVIEAVNIKGNIMLESTTSNLGTAFKMEQLTFNGGHGDLDVLKMSFTTNPISTLIYQSNGELCLKGGGISVSGDNGASAISLNKNGDFCAKKITIEGYGSNNVIEVWNGSGFKQLLITADGKFWGREVNVITANLPDYVFDSDYKLMELKDVENYININKHLPEVPTAKEVAANGMNVGEMNVILLKKTEELTLYLIEQNKQNEAQQKQIEAQQKQIEALMKKVNK